MSLPMSEAQAATEAVAHHAPTAGEYINHHLTSFGNKMHSGIVDFSVIHYDSVFWALFMGLVGLVFLWSVTRKATSGVPSRTQAAIEILFEKRVIGIQAIFF